MINSPNPEQQRVSSDNLKTHACLPCRQRKVKCDRATPSCSNCTKAKRQCSFIAPVRGVRKRTKPVKEGLHAKLRRYEELLKSCGVKIEPSDDVDETVSEKDALDTPASDADVMNNDDGGIGGLVRSWHGGLENEEITSRPKLITKEGTSRYFDNALWSKMGDVSRHPEGESIEQRTGELSARASRLFFGDGSQSIPDSLVDLHPPQKVVSKLQEIYADRVDPLMKIFHLPTFWAAISNGLKQPAQMPKDLQAAVFAFYLASISALKQDECNDLFGQQKTVMCSRYEFATYEALTNAKFLFTSSLMTLRAFSIYLQYVRKDYSCDTLFIFSGIAIRLACKMGLHRDGAKLGLPPFETEMRRRLWWYLVLVDFRTSDVLGVKPSLDLSSGDTKFPINLEDTDVSPDMAMLPNERKGITSITFCIIRCEMIAALQKSSTTEVTTDTAINQIEDDLESKYLRYCDPSNTLHVFLSIVVRSLICKIRLTAHTPQELARRPATPSERNTVFTGAIKLLEYIILLRSGHQGLDKYASQTGNSFLWNAMLYVLIEMRRRKTGLEVDRAWQVIGRLFDYYPQICEVQTGSVFVALGKWTLEVWDDYVLASKEQGLEEPILLPYIEAIRLCRRAPPAAESQAPQQQHSSANLSFRNETGPVQGLTTENTVDPTTGLDVYDFPDLLSFEMDPDEWIQWEQLISEPNRSGGDGMEF